MQFVDRGRFTAQQIVDELEVEMDIMFEHHIDGIDYDDMMEDADRVAAARRLFENVDGIPSGSSAYGIFLNSYGASVFGLHAAPGRYESTRCVFKVFECFHFHQNLEIFWKMLKCCKIP